MEHPPRPDPLATSERCPLTAALDAVGGRWSLIALYWLASGARRFNQLQRLMPAISHKVLTQTLRHLEQHRLIARQLYPEVPPRVEYSLTAHGRTLEPLIEAVRVWGHVHLQAGAASAADTVGSGGADLARGEIRREI
jgi:DNA-binding HxlR family transcriptional regulator